MVLAPKSKSVKIISGRPTGKLVVSVLRKDMFSYFYEDTSEEGDLTEVWMLSVYSRSDDKLEIRAYQAATSKLTSMLIHEHIIREHAGCVVFDRFIRETLPFAVELYYPSGSDIARLRFKASAFPELHGERLESERMQQKKNYKKMLHTATLSTGQTTTKPTYRAGDISPDGEEQY